MFVVSWEPIYHEGLDFLMPLQGSGRKSFKSKHEADEFAKKLRRDGVQVGSDAGQEVFGNELKITIKRK